MKRDSYLLFLVLLMSLMTSVVFAQSIISPTYTRKDNPSLQITEINQTPDYTIIVGQYKNILHYGWVNINNSTYIKDCKTGQKYKIIKSEGLPMSPQQLQITENDQELINFKFFFPSLENKATLIDLIEDERSTSSFNFYGIALDNSIERPFKIEYNQGHKFSSKPNLQSRINGVKEIQIYVPSNTSDLDKYIYGNIISYFHKLGLRVDVVQASFEHSTQQVGSVYAIHKIFGDDISDYLKNANTLAMVVNYTQTRGQYVGGTALHITFVDYVNGYTWNIQNLELPNKGEKFIKKLNNAITNSYSYDSSLAFVPPSQNSTWNERIFRENIVKDGADAIEGIYKGDKYTIGIKKHDNGNYYILYFDGADNIEDWKDGDIKGVLRPTASSSIFKMNWLGKWKQDMEYTMAITPVGFIMTDNENDQESYLKMFPNAEVSKENSPSSGTGFFLTKNGYIITNSHVIKGAKSIQITGINGDYATRYNATIKIEDKQNDLAIIKINDKSFIPLNRIPYKFKFSTSSIGEDCFVLGYPLISSMGMDIKLTNGIISSKTGYDGNVAQYQISAPIQPGNSGGPLFDKNGNVIGIIQAKHTIAENAGYAIKSSYIKNLIELLSEDIILPTNNMLVGKALPQQVELASKAVCIIIVNEK